MSVRTDYLNLIVNVNGNAAKKEYSDLKAKQAELANELNKIKRYTDDYVKKSERLDKVKTTLSSLKEEANNLKQQLGGSSAQTEIYISKSKQLENARERYKSILSVSEELSDRIGRMTTGTKEHSEAIKKLAGVDKELKATSDQINRLNTELSDTTKYNPKFLELKNRFSAISSEIDALTKEQKDLKAELKHINQETEEYLQKKAEYDEVTKKVNEMRGQIDLSALSIKDLRKEISRMTAVRDVIDPNSEAFKELDGRIKQAEGRMKDLTQGTGFLNKSFNFLKKELLAFGLIAVTALGADYVIGKIGNMIQRNAELSDSLADVARYTNLADAEVKDLYNNLKYIDTRTPRKALLDLASDAGKLGISGKRNIENFIVAADRIKVALGDDLGEDAILKLTKLNSVFKISEKYGFDTSKALTNIGSVINKIGAESAAAEAYLVDFMSRTGPVASQANMLITDIAGIASASDQLNLSAEVTATVFNQLIPKMFTDTATFARIAKMDVSEFAQLLQSDGNAALMAFLEGLKGNNDGMGVMAEKLKDIEIDGTRGIAVLAALSQNTKMISDAQKSANEEFQSGQSIMDEFNKRNTNFAANIERIKKGIAGWFVNSGVIEGFEKLAQSVAKFFAIPLSEKLEDERQKLRMVELQLNQTNLPQEERIKLIKELQQQYPALLGNMDAETVSNTQLSSAIKKVNDQLVNKIILQKKDEEIADQNNKIAEERLKLFEYENKLMAEMVKLSEKYKFDLPQGGDLRDQALKVADLVRQATFKPGKSSGGIFDPLFSFDRIFTNFDRVQSWLNGLESQGTKMINERKALMKRLGIDDTQTVDPTTNSTSTTQAPVLANAPSDKEVDKIKEQLNKVKEAVNQFKRDLELASLSDDERALEQIYDKYQKEIEAAAGFSVQIKQLEALRDEEYFAKRSEIQKKLQDERAKERKTLNDEIQDEREKVWLESKTEQERAEIELAKHYENLGLKLDAALKKKTITQQEHDAYMQLLQELHLLGIAAITDKYRSEDEKKLAEHLRKKADLEREIANNPWVDQDPFQQERQRIADHYRELEEQAKEHYGKKAEDAQIYSDLMEQIAQQREAALTAVELDEMAARRDARVQAYQAIAGATGDFITMLTSEQQKMSKAQKAATLLQISMDTASAISSLMKMSEANPTNAVTFGGAAALQFASGIIRIMANVGMAMKTLMAPTASDEANKVKQKAKGGYADVRGEDDNRSYSARLLPGFEQGYLSNPALVLAGENGREYFVNNDMLQNKTVASVVEGIEALSRGRINTVDFSNMLEAIGRTGRGPSTGAAIAMGDSSPQTSSTSSSSSSGSSTGKPKGGGSGWRSDVSTEDVLLKMYDLLQKGIKAEAYIGDQTVIDFKKRQQYLDKIEREAN